MHERVIFSILKYVTSTVIDTFTLSDVSSKRKRKFACLPCLNDVAGWLVIDVINGEWSGEDHQVVEEILKLCDVVLVHQGRVPSVKEFEKLLNDPDADAG